MGIKARAFDVVNVWGPWAAAIVAVLVLVERKSDLPDVVEPLTVAEADAKIAPIQQSANNSDYDRAVKGISWATDPRTLRSGRHSPAYLHEQLCGNAVQNVEGYYRTFQRVTQTKHHTEGARCQ